MIAYTDFASVYDVFMEDIPYEEWATYLKTLLEEYQCKDGLLLELGCGTGNMTQLLAQSGYDMIGLDNSVDMLNIAKRKTEKLTIVENEIEEHNITKNKTKKLNINEEEIVEEIVEEIEEEKVDEIVEEIVDDKEKEKEKEIVDEIEIEEENEMLQNTKTKKEDGQSDILYLLQDMREFELYGTVKAVVSICDSINYMLEQNDLRKVFSLVNNYLDPKGIFIFDFNTVYKYREVIGDSVIAENREDSSFIWENYYDEEEHINEYDLTIFVKEEKSYYRKFSETHFQRGYELEEIKELIQESGLQFVTAYDAFTRNEPYDQSERIYVIAQECGK